MYNRNLSLGPSGVTKYILPWAHKVQAATSKWNMDLITHLFSEQIDSMILRNLNIDRPNALH